MNTTKYYRLASFSYCLGLLFPDFIIPIKSGWKEQGMTAIALPYGEWFKNKDSFHQWRIEVGNISVRFLRIRKSLICLMRFLRSSLLLSTCSFVALVLSKTSCAFCLASSALCFASETWREWNGRVECILASALRPVLQQKILLESEVTVMRNASSHKTHRTLLKAGPDPHHQC